MKYSQSAFPYILNLKDGSSVVSNGMTLRDYFAAKAMQGFMYGAPTNDDINGALGNLAEMSYKLADAMLAAREKA